MDTVRYNAGLGGYFKVAAQSGQYVSPTASSDPSVAAPTSIVGPCALPGWDINDNFRAVEGIGSGRDLGQVPGRRECSLRTRIDVSDASFLTYAIRNHEVPGTRATGWEKGLKLLTCGLGIGSQYSDDDLHMVGVDALFQSLRLEIAENQNLTADVELWPICIMDAAPSQSAGPAYCVPIIWQSLTWTVNGVDLKPWLSGASISIANTLERVGSRPQLTGGSPAAELAISRTPYSIVPKLEKTTVQYRLHDDAPSTMRKTLYPGMGQVVFYGEAPGVGAGRPTCTITIANNYLSHRSGQQTQANNMLTYTADTASHAISIAAGLTS